MECLECLCCCFDFGTSTPPNRNIIVSDKKSRRSAVKNRLVSKYSKEDFLIVSDADRK